MSYKEESTLSQLMLKCMVLAIWGRVLMITVFKRIWTSIAVILLPKTWLYVVIVSARTFVKLTQWPGSSMGHGDARQSQHTIAAGLPPVSPSPAWRDYVVSRIPIIFVAGTVGQNFSRGFYVNLYIHFCQWHDRWRNETTGRRLFK